MSRKFMKVFRGLSLNPQSTAPTDPAKGDMYCDTDGKIQKYDGITWAEVGAGGGSGTATAIALTNVDGPLPAALEASVGSIILRYGKPYICQLVSGIPMWQELTTSYPAHAPVMAMSLMLTNDGFNLYGYNGYHTAIGTNILACTGRYTVGGADGSKFECLYVESENSVMVRTTAVLSIGGGSGTNGVYEFDLTSTDVAGTDTVVYTFDILTPPPAPSELSFSQNGTQTAPVAPDTVVGTATGIDVTSWAISDMDNFSIDVNGEVKAIAELGVGTYSFTLTATNITGSTTLNTEIVVTA